MKLIEDVEKCVIPRVRYPSDISLGVGAGWDPDVTRGSLIRKDHDRSMYFRLTGLKWSEGEV